ncbi:MAG TPA: hypothetical protein VK327_11120 [Candidatus Paceibacterota bacterium]|nr:hypothetical protein [Candidatus Paceibacterota bacterium]
MAQIGLAFRLSSGDLGYELYPFHVSTNLGGTKEFRAIGPDGFDTNAHYHLQVLSNYLSFPGLLVCPGDVQRAPAADFSALQSGNVTYQLRTGDPVTENNPSEILLVCPIDGNIVYADGTVPNYP